MSKNVINDFAMRVAQQVTGVPLNLIENVVTMHSPGFTASKESSVALQNELDPYGIDPMTILAIITAIIQVMDLLKNGCNKPAQFAENARVRNPLLLAIFYSRVWMAAKRAEYPRKPRQLADALLDVAHATGATRVAEVVEALDMI